MTLKPVILAAAVAAASFANAAEKGDSYITLGAGYSDNEIFDDFKTTDGHHVNNSWTNEVSLGYHFLPSLAGELSVTLPGVFQGDKKPDITQYQLKGLYFFGDDALKPYLTAGFGLEELDVPQDSALDETTHVFTYGAGLQYDFTEKVFGRAEYAINEMTDESNEHGVAMLELGVRFGAPSHNYESTEIVVDKTEPAVEEQPEPQPEVIIKKEPVPVIVEVQPVDTDADGVEDEIDQCPDTISGATVDAKGCAAFEGSLDGVKFESGSARLTANAMIILDDAAAEIRKYPELKILVAAHTDSQGSAAFNQQLSQKRAESVRQYLIGKGVKAASLTAEGFGEAQPVASNDTAEGRAQNRRVELNPVK